MKNKQIYVDQVYGHVLISALLLKGIVGVGDGRQIVPDGSD